MRIFLLVDKMTKPIVNVSDLAGEQISGVAFVCDYVEFHFDGPILRSLSPPMAIVNGRRYKFPENGSRDALCTIIGSTVRRIELEDDQALQITTSNDRQVIIGLNSESRSGPEAMHFVPEQGGPIQVW